MIIYFDMDGVLADWIIGFERMFPEISIEDFENLTEDERTTYLMKTDSDPTFYSSLPPINHMIRVLVMCCTRGYNVEILTSVGKQFPDNLTRQKKEWVEHYLGNLKVNTVNSPEEKANYARPNRILIDDNPACIDPFIEAGGHGILVSNAYEVSTFEILTEIDVLIAQINSFVAVD